MPRYVKKDVGRPRFDVLSPRKQEELDTWVRQILYRWKPMTEDPENLARDLYELIEWVLDEEEPSCPLLKD